MKAEFYRQLQRLLLEGKSPRLESSLTCLGKERLVWAEGSIGEEVDEPKFVQTLTAPTRLVICGGGHVARALAQSALQVGFAVTVLEDRADLLRAEYFPQGVELKLGDSPELIAHNYGSNPFFAIMTRGHEMDQICLEAVLKGSYGYVGVMGSRRKASITHQRLGELGYTQAVIDAVHIPIGLAIGAETPAEIAVSVTAQLISCRKELGVEAPLDGGLISALDKPPYALVTLVDCKGSTPRGEGARMLVFPDGSIRGTIGGGAGEAMATAQAVDVLNGKKQAQIYTYRMDGSAESVCGGTVQYMIIPVREDDASC